MLPSRASDAGPISHPEPPPTWDDHAEAAIEDLRDARRLYRDDLTLQRKLRLEALDRAAIAIEQARALLEVPKRVEIAPQDEAERVRAFAVSEVLG